MLVLNASQTAFYNDVVQVLDVMRQVGGDRVALSTQPSAETNQPPGATPSYQRLIPQPVPPRLHLRLIRSTSLARPVPA